MNDLIPRSNAVRSWRSPSCTAIWPNADVPPVATATPSPDPDRTIVPISAHDGRSSGESPDGDGAVVFATGSVSPVRTASSHSRAVTSIKRTSAGTICPSFEPNQVARNEVGHIDLDISTLTMRRATMSDTVMQCLDRAL